MQELTTDSTIVHLTEAETDKAFLLAIKKHIPVLVDFWAPGCKGCKKMDLSTYRNPEIQRYIENNFVFVKYNITNRNISKIQSSSILWTPTFIVFANDGSEVRKITGYLNDLRFIAEVEIGRAMALLRKAQPHAALRILEALLAEADNKPLFPEALYWAGVATYFKNQRDPESLGFYWEKLMNYHPDSDWAHRADILKVVL